MYTEILLLFVYETYFNKIKYILGRAHRSQSDVEGTISIERGINDTPVNLSTNLYRSSSSLRKGLIHVPLEVNNTTKKAYCNRVLDDHNRSGKI